MPHARDIVDGMSAPARPRDRTRTEIVQAAARLLQEGGATAVTTRGVAEAAGVQAPALYRLFGDKDGLLEAVAEHVMDTYVQAKAAEARAAVDPLDDLRRGWASYLDFGLANPALFALLTDPRRSADSPASRAGMQVLAARVHRLAEHGLLRTGEARAVALVHAAGVGTVSPLLALPASRRDPGLAQAMLDAVLQQVLHVPSGDGVQDTGEEPGLVPAAVRLRAHADELTALSAPERLLLAEWLDRVVDQG